MHARYRHNRRMLDIKERLWIRRVRFEERNWYDGEITVYSYKTWLWGVYDAKLRRLIYTSPSQDAVWAALERFSAMRRVQHV